MLDIRGISHKTTTVLEDVEAFGETTVEVYEITSRWTNYKKPFTIEIHTHKDLDGSFWSEIKFNFKTQAYRVRPVAKPIPGYQLTYNRYTELFTSMDAALKRAVEVALTTGPEDDALIANGLVVPAKRKRRRNAPKEDSK